MIEHISIITIINERQGITMNITVYDRTSKQVVAELMTATPNDVLKFIQKGFKVIDNFTKQELSESDVLSMVGMSECVI